jgi:hypothetical protein
MAPRSPCCATCTAGGTELYGTECHGRKDAGPRGLYRRSADSTRGLVGLIQPQIACGVSCSSHRHADPDVG